MIHRQAERGTQPDVEIYFEAPEWRGLAPSLEQSLRKAVIASLLRAPSAQEERGGLTILLADDNRLRALNQSYRGKDTPTNVLSFPPARRTGYLGDIAIAFETAEREAREMDKPMADHVIHLAVHGVLHLLEYDHQTPDEAESMEALEIEILSQLGIPDPYRQRNRAA